MTTTKEKLKQFLADDLLVAANGPDIQDHDDLLLSGLIDSLGVIRLITFIEEAFATHVPPEDVTIEHFGTLQAMANYLDGKQAA